MKLAAFINAGAAAAILTFIGITCNSIPELKYWPCMRTLYLCLEYEISVLLSVLRWLKSARFANNGTANSKGFNFMAICIIFASTSYLVFIGGLFQAYYSIREHKNNPLVIQVDAGGSRFSRLRDFLQWLLTISLSPRNIRIHHKHLESSDVAK